MMETTKDFVEAVLDSVVNRLSFINSTRFIGRQDPTGVIIENNEWAGLNDTAGNLLYVRYRDDIDHEYEAPERRLTSQPEQVVIARLRGVLMHTCTNEDDIERALWNELMIAPHLVAPGEFHIRVLRTSKDKQAVFMQETGKEETTDTKWSLLAVDFDLAYKVIANRDVNCLPACDVC